jgi:NTE family protein
MVGQKRVKTALVLSGGGAGGAFQIGVLNKLWQEEEPKVSAIYGTSVGALNGAALKHIGLKELNKIWLNIKGKGDVLKFNWLTLIGMSKGKYSTKPLSALVESVVSNEPVNKMIEVLVSVVNLETSEISYHKSGSIEFQDMVLASACVPFHMEPVGMFVDGGVRDHTPIAKAIEDGANRIIVICNNPLQRKQRDIGYKPKWPYLVDIGLRCTDILQSEILYGDLVRALDSGIEFEIYAPDIRIIDTFEYDPEKIRQAIDQGYNTLPKFNGEIRI